MKKPFVYCSNIKCTNSSCLRNIAHQPWNEVMKQRKWEPNNKGHCEGECLK